MTNEQAKSELMQIYMSLSEEKKQAIDVGIQALEQEPKAEKVIKMRDATHEEQEAVDKYIKSISKPTGVNIFDFYEDEDKSCDNCKHHLKFMCKKWETCHNYSDWELEELDFVQPHKTIPCKIKVADGEYISRKALLEDLYKRDYTKFTHRDFVALVQYQDIVAIPSAEPKTGHWIEEDMFDGDVAYRCSECDELFWIESGTPKDNGYNFCPKCGKRLVEPQERSDKE